MNERDLCREVVALSPQRGIVHVLLRGIVVKRRAHHVHSVASGFEQMKDCMVEIIQPELLRKSPNRTERGDAKSCS